MQQLTLDYLLLQLPLIGLLLKGVALPQLEQNFEFDSSFAPR
jgi:hypothetical protein